MGGRFAETEIRAAGVSGARMASAASFGLDHTRPD
jgi:hypothetical protein